MRYVPDKTGRFRRRPHYLPADLDLECESIITEFTQEICGEFTLPISTDILTKLIEREAQYLDLYADLSQEEGSNVEGVTDFYAGEKPTVRIASMLSEGVNRGHRLRTTLTHEYGHVRFHNCLYQLTEATDSLFPDAFEKRPAKCRRETMLDAPASDWMEWQAGYICGAILMPISYVKEFVGNYRRQNDLVGSISERSKEGLVLLADVAKTFDVSRYAARVRLLKLNHLTSAKQQSILY